MGQTGYIAAVETQEQCRRAGPRVESGRVGGRLGTGAAAIGPFIGRRCVKVASDLLRNSCARMTGKDSAKIAPALCDL